ncbi:YgaP family membrane protein [Candidatus Magnetominusculus xianensis]|uniref:Membrane protein n=1 Tax=Candidatus Magnetominusculus xianensis TaxID=1748249 RepID=A0ABR5SCH2_9BACT|nr:membrane protein [Candidatus Magnetominusculus xianensis]
MVNMVNKEEADSIITKGTHSFKPQHKTFIKSCCLHTYVLISRIILGTLLIAIGVYFKSWQGAITVIPIASGFIGICLIHKILGLSVYGSACKLE